MTLVIFELLFVKSSVQFQPSRETGVSIFGSLQKNRGVLLLLFLHDFPMRSSSKVDGQLLTMHHGDCLPLFGEEPWAQ